MTRILDRLKLEPSVILSLVTAGVTLALAFGVQLSNDQTGAVVALTVAVMAVGKALAVRPFYWPVLSGLAQAVLALLLAFGVGLTPGQLGPIMAVVNMLLGLAVRSQVTPETRNMPLALPVGGPA